MSPSWIERRLRAWRPRFPERAFRVSLWALASLALVVPLGLVAVPFIEFFNDMAAHPKARTLGMFGRRFGREESVDRPRPRGALPQAGGAYPFPGREDADAERAAAALANPRSPDLASTGRGRRIYDIYCIACHGPLGEADGPVVGPERFPAPTSLHDKALVGYPDGRIYHVISVGKGKMQGYADKVEPQARWDVVNYVRVLQRALAPKAEDFER